MSWRRLHIHMFIMEAKRWQTPAAPEGPPGLIMGSAGVSLILPGKSDGICAGGLIYADCFGPIAAYLQCVPDHCIRDFWLHLHRIISRHHIASITSTPPSLVAATLTGHRTPTVTAALPGPESLAVKLRLYKRHLHIISNPYTTLQPGDIPR